MLLNETKPPLDEALEHFGVRGMHWGQRKNRSSNLNLDAYDEAPKKNHTVAKVATVGAVVLGAAAVAVILKKNGTFPTHSLPKSPFADRTFRPKTVTPLLSLAPKSSTPNIPRTFRPKNITPLLTIHPKAPEVAKLVTKGESVVKGMDKSFFSRTLIR